MREGRERGAEISNVVSELRRAGKGATKAANCAEWLAAEADAERRRRILEAARLAKHPNHVRKKKTAKTDKSRCETHIWPMLGDKPLAEITLEDCERVVSEAPEGSQRHVAQLLGYMLATAVYPMKLLAVSPLPPRKWLPKKGPRKALSCLYPEEEAQLLGCCEVPLENRVLYGFVTREGMRAREALRMTWGDLDPLRDGKRSQRVDLDENKTDDPRNWTLDDGIAEALRRWRKLVRPKEHTDRVFARLKNKGHLADVLRTRHLRLRGSSARRSSRARAPGSRCASTIYAWRL